MDQLLQIIKEYHLDFHFAVLLQKNRSNDSPYHNLNHSLCVMHNCYRLAKSENLNEDETKELIIASIYHDFGHSLGKDVDAVNIERAKKYYLLYSRDSQSVKHKVCMLIETTQYPYLVTENLSLQQKIIRDADSMQLLEDNYLQQTIVGFLMGELNMNLKTAILNQIKFMNTLTFHTDLAKNIAAEKLPARIEMMNYIKKLINL